MMKNREIEIKLQINDINEIGKIRAYLKKLAQSNSNNLEKITMKAVYYDTKEGFLQKNKMAYRIRQEDKNIVATYKSGTINKNNVFERVEVNKNVQNLEPNINAFADENELWKTLKVLENSKFIPIVKTDFIREYILINWQESQIEIALDLGKIIGKNNEIPICELELELKNGNEKSLLDLKDILMKEFNIVPSTDSKYHRGLILAGLS